MNTITVCNIGIRQDSAGRYCLNDFHRAAGNENRHRPSLWVENQQTKELVVEVAKAGIPALNLVKGGNAPGTYVCKELVLAYAMWISAKFHLEVIRAYDAMTMQRVPPQQRIRGAALPSPVNSILAIGRELKKLKGMNEALAMAATFDTIQRNTGLDLSLMTKALPSVELEDVAKLNATEVGEPLGMKARPLNLLLAELGMQYRDDRKEWRLTEAGTAFGEMKPFHRHGHSGYEIRWKESVIEFLRGHINKMEKAS